MASINEILERVSRLKPTVGVDQRDMGRWLCQLDGQIYQETMKKTAPDVKPPERWPEDGDKPLLLPEEYSEAYVWWVIANIELSQREYGNYNNSLTMYDRFMDRFMAWYRRENKQNDTLSVQNVLY